jgi:glycosyltransferase involved in cell wall biosynthesis
MLSICIPIYNQDVTTLVSSLDHQIRRLDVFIEIIGIDDCSDLPFRAANKLACEKSGRYIQLNKNIGRAKIRNLFLEYTTCEYLLFLDCDAVVISDHFIESYINTLSLFNSPIICGGSIYDTKKPERQMRLRWTYGHKKESKPVVIRMQQPNKSFMTRNFIIRKELLERIRFEERIVGYGHEDTLLGFRLKKEGIPIMHLDNPVLNGDLESNEEFLTKTECGLSNLVYILRHVSDDSVFIEDVTILSVYQKCRQWHVTGLVTFLFKLSGFSLRHLLKTGYGNLTLLNMYKLGFLTLKMNTLK